MLLAGVFGACRILGMRRVFFGVLGVDTLVMAVFFAGFRDELGGRCLGGSRIGQRHRRQRLAGVNMIVLPIGMIVRLVVIMRVVVRMLVTIVVMMFRFGMGMSGVVGMIGFGVDGFGVFL